MTATVDTTEIRLRLSPWHRLRAATAAWAHRHALSLAVLAPVLLVAGAVHAIGMSTFPRYVDDPGTYLAQAWSLRYETALTPYSYFYDHAPAGWMQIALWALLTGGFDRYASAVDFGNECMLIAKLVSCALLYALGRRLGLHRASAAAAVLAFALSPLALAYTRWAFLDNLVTPWLLAAFVLACSPRRTILSGVGAAAAFAIAVLTKETALVTAPAFIYAMAQNLDRRNRAQVIVMSAFTGIMLLALYPLFALYKGELFPGKDHNSLLETAYWQLAQRESSGSVLDSGSPAHGLLTSWLGEDPFLLLAGLAAVPVAVFARRLRPVALLLLIQWAVLVRGGYVPYMHVITLLPWSALLAAGAVDALARRWRPLAALPAIGAAAVVALAWTPALVPMMTVRAEQPLRAATEWVADNVPRDKVLVVHDSIWTDLVHRYGYRPRPIMIYKLDTDPAVTERLRRVDYLIVPNWYYATDAQRYPTLIEARRHAVPVASFGAGNDGVKVYRVSRFWQPR